MEIFSVDKFLNKKYTFINEPIHLNENDYRNALHAFVEKFSAYSNVVSIYKFGTISSIGISDLDFIVILKEEPLIQDSKDLAYRSFSKKEIYIYNNTPPMYMTEKIFRNFNQLFPLKGLKLLYGRDIKQENMFNHDVYDMLTLIELLGKFYPKIFLELLYSNSFNTRRALMLLHALQFPIDLASNYFEIDSTWLQYKNKIRKLREQWYTMGYEKYSLLISLGYEAVNVSLDLIDKVREYLSQKTFLKSNHEDAGRIIGSFQKGRTLFIRNFSAKRALDMLLERYESTIWPKRFSLVLPDIYVLPLVAYMDEDGVLSEHIRKNLKISDAFRESLIFKTEAKKRIAVLNSLMSFIEKYKVFPNGVHIYYGYWPKVGLKNHLIQRLVNTGLL